MSLGIVSNLKFPCELVTGISDSAAGSAIRPLQRKLFSVWLAIPRKGPRDAGANYGWDPKPGDVISIYGSDIVNRQCEALFCGKFTATKRRSRA